MASAFSSSTAKKAAIASSSLLALSAALGWSSDASAAGTCGAPNSSGLVNCTHKTYPAGIEYSAIDDLTVNVGSFAGQHHPVSLTGGIAVVSSFTGYHSTSETLNVGKNVTITAGTSYGDNAISVGAATSYHNATATVDNKASLTATAGDGISAGSYVQNSYSPQTAATTVKNSGDIHSYRFGIDAEANAYANTAITTVDNSGAIVSGSGIFVLSRTKIDNTYSDVTGTAYGIVKNSGAISAQELGIWNRSAATINGEDAVTAISASTVHNSGAIETTATGGGITYLDAPAGITASSEADAYAGTEAHASASAIVSNSGAISTSGEYGFGIYVTSSARAFSYGAYTASGVATSSVQNSGAITTQGDFATAISVRTQGYSRGHAYAQQAAYASVTNSGAISTAGSQANAISVSSYSNAYGSNAVATATSTVDNSGPVVTTGAYSAGINASSRAVANSNAPETTSTANAITAIKNTGSITTSGIGSDGIFASSYAAAGLHSGPGGSPYTGIANATTVINNSGAIKTSGGAHYGSGANGLYASAATEAYGFRNAYATSTVNITNSGEVTTSGEYANGIKVVAISAAYGEKACTFCFAGGYTVARSYATISNSGTVKTSGEGAAGLFVQSTGYSLTKGFGYSYQEAVIANSGHVTTNGSQSDGIRAAANGDAAFLYFTNTNVSTTAAVNNSGTVTTTGDFSTGIYVLSKALTSGLQRSIAYANTFVANSGQVATSGQSANDITVITSSYSTQGDAIVRATSYITNAGTLTAKGNYSAGIESVARAYSAVPATTYHSSLAYVATNSSIVNGGSISTSGNRSDGIFTFANASALSYYYSNVAANATVGNNGTIKTTGDYSDGISAQAGAINTTRLTSNYWSQAVASTTVSNTGAISVSGNRADGIAATSYALAIGGKTGSANATTTVINAGTIAVDAQYAHGIYAASSASVRKAGSEGTATATTYVANLGTISAKSGVGILAETSSYDQDGVPGVSGSGSAIASVLVANAGTIVAGDDGIIARAAFNGGGGISAISTTATVQNAGSITVTGDNGAGIVVQSGGLVAPGTGTVINAGTVSALGTNGTGVAISAYSSTAVNAAGGLINASGVGGVGVNLGGAQNALVTYAGSTISGGTGAGAYGVHMKGVLNEVGNSGTITSANDAAINMYAYAANVVKNTGVVTGTVAMTTGAKGQNVLYNYGAWNAVGGNSSFTHGAGGGSNLINEKGGTIVVVGSQTFVGLDDFTNLGLVDLTQAASASLGARPAFETLTVSGDYHGLGGALAVDASTIGGMHGDELVIKGAASGTTKVTPTILGTPGASAGNGILLVSAHKTTGASDFVLDGNAANGDEIAGAFEYNLAFDPGSGTSGKWYLQSQLYPGVFQFGQVQSSAALVADQVNPSLDSLMNQAFNNTVANASLDTPAQVVSNDSSFVPSPNGTGLSGWGRYDETRFNVDPNGSPFADYKLRVDAMQIGVDGTWHNAGNLVMFGGYITPFHVWSDFASFGGHIGMSGTAYGVYGLWFSGPWQAGLRLNTDNMTAHISDTFIGTNASVKPYERGAQAAVSYDMPLDWADFAPSAEFNYGTVNSVHFTDGAGNLVQVGSTNDLWGKLNGRFSWDVETAHNLLVQPYVNLGVLYRGDTGTRTTIGAFSTSTNVNGWDGDLAVGVNTNLAQSLSLSAQADYLAGDHVKGWTGFIGLRYTP